MYGFDNAQHQYQHSKHQHTHQQNQQDPQRNHQQEQESTVMNPTTTPTLGTDGVIPTILPDGTDLRLLLERLRREDEKALGAEVERSIGRVVFGRTGWEKWTNNPA
jgi:hypothetical protein